ncbi:MAG: 3-dehydroquinate synthase [Parachlamydiaceae bacterium]|nr:3-dehydroquinate synthase [Parachlamydiaceae bacterium]
MKTPLSSLVQLLEAEHYSSCMILSQPPIYSLYGESLQRELQQLLPTFYHLVPCGESLKNIESATACWQAMHQQGLDRRSLVVAIGGGALTDLAGFVAACYMRGIDVVYIPTTLMGMVDAAIGGKTGVNLPSGKNLVGVFRKPKQVIIRSDYLKTLPKREFCSGLAEVIKYGVIWDPTFFTYLEENMDVLLERNETVLRYVVERSYQIKNEIVEQDVQENGLRAILNWGHTFAHALETLTDYQQYTHGEAVSIGMCCAARVSAHLGYVDQNFVERQHKLCQRAGLQKELPSDVSIERLVECMKRDKKAVAQHISLVIANGMGQVELVVNVDPNMILEALTS